MAFGKSSDDTSQKTKGVGALSMRDQIVLKELSRLIGLEIAAALAEDRAARINK